MRFTVNVKQLIHVKVIKGSKRNAQSSRLPKACIRRSSFLEKGLLNHTFLYGFLGKIQINFLSKEMLIVTTLSAQPTLEPLQVS